MSSSSSTFIQALLTFKGFMLCFKVTGSSKLFKDGLCLSSNCFGKSDAFSFECLTVSTCKQTVLDVQNKIISCPYSSCTRYFNCARARNISRYYKSLYTSSGCKTKWRLFHDGCWLCEVSSLTYCYWFDAMKKGVMGVIIYVTGKVWNLNQIHKTSISWFLVKCWFHFTKLWKEILRACVCVCFIIFPLL